MLLLPKSLHFLTDARTAAFCFLAIDSKSSKLMNDHVALPRFTRQTRTFHPGIFPILGFKDCKIPFKAIYDILHRIHFLIDAKLLINSTAPSVLITLLSNVK